MALLPAAFDPDTMAQGVGPARVAPPQGVGGDLGAARGVEGPATVLATGRGGGGLGRGAARVEKGRGAWGRLRPSATTTAWTGGMATVT